MLQVQIEQYWERWMVMKVILVLEMAVLQMGVRGLLMIAFKKN